jgi:hypothetical protein
VCWAPSPHAGGDPVIIKFHDVANRRGDRPGGGGETHKVLWRCCQELAEGGLVALAPSSQSGRPVVGAACRVEVDSIRPADEVCGLEVTERVDPAGGALGQEAERAKKFPQFPDIGADFLGGGKQRSRVPSVLFFTDEQKGGLVRVEQGVLDDGGALGVAGEHGSVQDRSGELVGWYMDDVLQARVGSQAGRRRGIRWGRSRGDKAAEAEE